MALEEYALLIWLAFVVIFSLLLYLCWQSYSAIANSQIDKDTYKIYSYQNYNALLPKSIGAKLHFAADSLVLSGQSQELILPYREIITLSDFRKFSNEFRIGLKDGTIWRIIVPSFSLWPGRNSNYMKILERIREKTGPKIV